MYNDTSEELIIEIIELIHNHKEKLQNTGLKKIMKRKNEENFLYMH